LCSRLPHYPTGLTSAIVLLKNTFYFRQEHTTFLGLNWGSIEDARFLEDTSLVEMEKSSAVLVFFVKVHDGCNPKTNPMMGLIDGE
jgi:hypothetical protein